MIPLWADILAVGLGALQGALFASNFRERRLDLLGVAIVGIASGLGGGLIRDTMLSELPAAMQSNWYLPVAVAAALLGMLLERVFSRLNATITVLDALTIGLFGAIGTTKALALGVPEVPAVFVGMLSAVGGSILRDVLLNIPIALMHVGSLYAVAALLGSVSLVVLLILDVPVFIAAVVCVAVTFVIRVLAVLFNWSLPEQKRLERIPSLPRLPRIGRSSSAATVSNRKSRLAKTRTTASPRTAAIPRVGGANPSPQTRPIPTQRAGSAPKFDDTRTGSLSRVTPPNRPVSTSRLPRGLRKRPE